MNAVQFYNPSSIPPSLSANCAATLQKHNLFAAISRHKEQNYVHEPFSLSQNTNEEMTSKQNRNNIMGNRSISADEDDEFPPIDEVIRAQSTLLGHLDGSSKEQPVILDDDDDNNDNNNSEDGDEASDDNDNSSSTSGRGISSQDFGPLPSPTTLYPESKPSSSCNPSLQPTALYDQLPESQVIQQDDGCISREMSEQPSCPVLILSDDEDDDMEERQQQEAGEDREQEAHNHGTSSNGDVDDDDSHLQDNNKSEGLQTTKQRRPSPSCDSVIRRGHKRQHQETWQRKEQECQESNNTDRKDDQDSDDSEGPRPAKRRGPSVSSNNSTQMQHLQRPHDDDSVSKHTSKHDLQQSRKRDTTLVQNQLEQSSSISNNGCRQSRVAPASTSDQEPVSATRAEYQEWPIFGVFKRVIAGDEARYGVEFSLELRTCPQHTVVQQSPDGGDPQPSDSWEIQRITGMRKVNGVKEFRVTWAQTWMPESELGGAKELVEEFKGRLSARHRKEQKHSKPDITVKKKLKRRPGRPRKQV